MINFYPQKLEKSQRMSPITAFFVSEDMMRKCSRT